MFLNGSTHRGVSSKFFADDVGVCDAPATPAARERPRVPLSFGFERENDGGEEIANFPSNLYGPNDGS